MGWKKFTHVMSKDTLLSLYKPHVDCASLESIKIPQITGDELINMVSHPVSKVIYTLLFDFQQQVIVDIMWKHLKYIMCFRVNEKCIKEKKVK